MIYTGDLEEQVKLSKCFLKTIENNSKRCYKFAVDGYSVNIIKNRGFLLDKEIDIRIRRKSFV